MSTPHKDNRRADLDKYFAHPEDTGNLRSLAVPNFLPAVASSTKEVGPGLQLGVGLNAPALDVATPAVFTPAVAVVMSVPAMYAPDGNYSMMGTLIKNLVESHSKSITGIDVEYTLNTDTNAIVGHDGQNMSVPTKTTRNAQSPSITMQELSGNLVYETFTKWMWDISHPDTYVSMAGDMFPGAWTMSAYAMSLLVIQFDPTMRPDRIIDAAFISNLFPTTVGSLGLERTLGTTKAPERNITFAQAIIQHNKYVRLMAVEVAKQLQLHTVNYDYAPTTFDNVNTSINQTGLLGEVADRGWQGYHNPNL